MVITTFFQKVAQLEMTHASPKHPQSATGSAMAIHSVSGSITAMKSSTMTGEKRRKLPVTRNTPVMNSRVNRMNANVTSSDCPAANRSIAAT